MGNQLRPRSNLKALFQMKAYPFTYSTTSPYSSFSANFCEFSKAFTVKALSIKLIGVINLKIRVQHG